MKVFIDNNLISQTPSDVKNNFKFKPESEDIQLNWPSLLNLIGLGDILRNLPPFDSNNNLYKYFNGILAFNPKDEYLFEVYDQMFAESLTEIKNLDEIQQSNLLTRIQKKRSLGELDLFNEALIEFEFLLREHPYEIMHDLILYLGWDRMCVRVAILFDECKSTNAFKSLEVLKNCLLESFEHITKQERTKPGFYRLVETLFAFEMREENLQKHQEEVWQILCKSTRALMPRDELMNAHYIDEAISNTTDKEPIRVITEDTPEKVDTVIALTNLMLRRIKAQLPYWPYTLLKSDIIHL